MTAAVWNGYRRVLLKALAKATKPLRASDLTRATGKLKHRVPKQFVRRALKGTAVRRHTTWRGTYYSLAPRKGKQLRRGTRKRQEPPDGDENFDLEDRYGLKPRQIDKLPVRGLTDEELRRFRRKLDAEYTKQQDAIVEAFNKVTESEFAVEFDGYEIPEDEEE